MWQVNISAASEHTCVCLSYFFVAVKRHHEQDNLDRKVLNWVLASVGEFMTTIVGSLAIGRQR